MGDSKTYTAGVKIETNHGAGAGTLGGFARDSQNRPVLVTASHVLFPGFKVINNMRVFCPNYSSSCCGGDPIGVPVFDRNQAAIKDDEAFAGDDKTVQWTNGYHNGTWTGGFHRVPAQIRSFTGSPVQGGASTVDCAIARLDPGISFHNVWNVEQLGLTIPIKGAVTEGFGIGKGPDFGTKPTAQQLVRIFSANTGQLRWGTMLSTKPVVGLLEPDPDHLLYGWGMGDSSDLAVGMKTHVRQFLILPRPAPSLDPSVSVKDWYGSNPEELTFEGGDSGSWVINHQNLVVGMLIRAGDPELVLKKELENEELNAIEAKSVRAVGVATPIWRILEHLNITIPTAAGGWSGTTPALDTRRVVAVATHHRRRDGVQVLADQLRQSTRGRLLLGKIAQHRREIGELLTSVRPITAAWRDLQGPRFVHHCIQSLDQPSHRVPDAINGVGRRRLADAMLPLFARYGSPGLRRDIERYGAALLEALVPVAGLADVPAALAHPGGHDG